MTKPVHVSIRDDLRMRITVGEWAAGDRLPSETDLAARYGVARMTVRQAIGALAGEGVVVRRQGLGTFAAERLPTRRVGALLSFTEEMRSQGRDVESRLIKAAVEQPTDLAREALQLAAHAATVTIQRIRIVDGYPIAVQHSWLPCARFAGLDAEPLLEDSLYATIEGRYGVRIMRARQVFTATAAANALVLRYRRAIRGYLGALLKDDAAADGELRAALAAPTRDWLRGRAHKELAALVPTLRWRLERWLVEPRV